MESLTKADEFNEWFNGCQTNEELTRAACCARDYHRDGHLTEIEYKRVCEMGMKRRKELQ